MASVAVGGRVVAGGGRRALVAVILAGIVGVVKKRRARVPGRPGVFTRMVVFVRDMAGSVAGFTALTVGLWQVNPVAGWCVLGVSLLLLDFQISTRGGSR